MFGLPLWLFTRILPALALVAGVWFGIVQPYNHYVSTKAVAAALVKERAITAPVIKRLGEWVAARDAKIEAIETASKAEALRQASQLEIKQKDYAHAIANTKTLKSRLDAMRGSDADFERLLNARTVNNSSSAGEASFSGRYDRLEAAHQQCERDIRYASETAAGTIERLSAAVAAIEALKQ